MCFANKVVIVTGASSGIGAETAILFATKGAKVAIVARNEAKLRAVAERCATLNKPTPLIIIADITKDDEAKTIVSKTINHYGKLDILINNAGIVRFKSITDEGFLEEYDDVMNTNLRAVVHITTLAAPHIVKTKGNIVNVSSVASLATLGLAGTPYSVSKAGLDHFTRCAALELAASGVRVNCLNPGPVKTEFAENNGIPGVPLEQLSQLTALKRFSEPEEMANIIMFLASEQANSITGSVYLADNGMLLKKTTI